MKPPVGRIKKMQSREACDSDAGAFTPWLAQPDNTTVLAGAIGLDLAVENADWHDPRHGILAKVDPSCWVMKTRIHRQKRKPGLAS